jgi:hypothetical protein
MRKASVIVAVLLLAVPALSAHGQSSDLLEVLKPVEEKQRPRLAQRLALFIEYHRTRQWDKLFELTDRYSSRDFSKEEFVRTIRKDQLDFAPERTIEDWPEYRVLGCVKARSAAGDDWWQGGIVAYLRDGDWHFSTYYLKYEGSVPLRCKDGPKRK